MLMRMFPIPFGLPGYWVSLAVGLVTATVGAWWPWVLPAGLVLLLAGSALPPRVLLPDLAIPPEGAAARALERRGLSAAAVPLVLAGQMAAGGGLVLLALAGGGLAVLPAEMDAPARLLRGTSYLQAVMDWAVPLVSAPNGALGGEGRWQVASASFGAPLALWPGFAVWAVVAALAAGLCQSAVMRSELARLGRGAPPFSVRAGIHAVLGGAALAGGTALLAMALSYTWETDGIGARQWFVTLPLALLFLAGGTAVLLELAAAVVRRESR